VSVSEANDRQQGSNAALPINMIMKIAIQISGQIRTGNENALLVRDFFKDFDTDYFIHTWDIDNKPGDYFGETKAISIHDFRSYFSHYSPRAILVEGYAGVFAQPLQSFIPLYYSAWRANQLRRDYENETGFRYDCVVKIRPDLIFAADSFGEDFEVFLQHPSVFHYGVMKGNHWANIGQDVDDTYWVASRENMDIASEFCRSPTEPNEKSWQQNMADYLTARGVAYAALPKRYMRILRRQGDEATLGNKDGNVWLGGGSELPPTSSW
jgi:hypothetical protein